ELSRKPPHFRGFVTQTLHFGGDEVVKPPAAQMELEPLRFDLIAVQQRPAGVGVHEGLREAARSRFLPFHADFGVAAPVDASQPEARSSSVHFFAGETAKGSYPFADRGLVKIAAAARIAPDQKEPAEASAA